MNVKNGIPHGNATNISDSECSLDRDGTNDIFSFEDKFPFNKIDDMEFTEPEILSSCSDTDDSVNGELTNEYIQELSPKDFSNEEVSQSERNSRKRITSKSLRKRKQRKIEEIEDVLQSEPVDLDKLRELACGDGGLIEDELRRKAWPRLMQIDKIECDQKPSNEYIESHPYYTQVVLDVNRTLKRFPPGINEDHRSVLMDQLTSLIVRVLDKHPHLHYYQGYHDVAITFLLVMGESMGFELVEKLSITHLHEFMRPTMERTSFYLMYLYPILRRANPELFIFLMRSGVGTVFCLPWLITWYAHTLHNYSDVVRLYDFFLASPYLMPMYIAAAIVLHRQRKVFEGECDMAMQHFILSRVPDSLQLEDILKHATLLYELYPPDELTEEVEQLIAIRAKEEEDEKRRLIQRKSERVVKSESLRPSSNLLHYLPLSPSQQRLVKGTVKVVLVAIAAVVATGFYGYYSNMDSLRGYIS